ncbi:hypothetical protein BLNAU_10241 [Blattamonas nauphoetae]|uniref:Uncharacterized protein n=1 Tax=Blattamonas nauphoetae TaxID=2049346 RepID=A0ABQ9XTG0_9EUKA|nr:hypothetical protein BLNAU_10241 [Blattamonas nauphoetae]
MFEEANEEGDDDAARSLAEDPLNMEGEPEGGIIAFLIGNGGGRFDNDPDPAETEHTQTDYWMGDAAKGAQPVESEPKLEEFIAEGSDFTISEEAFKMLVETALPLHSSNLHLLKIQSAEIDLPASGLVQILQSLPNLLTLDLSDCDNQTEFDLAYQAPSLDEDGEDEVDDEELDQDALVEMYAMQQGATPFALNSLLLSNTPTTTTAFLQHLSDRMGQATSLDLSFSGKKLGDSDLALLRTMDNIRTLNLSGWSKVTHIGPMFNVTKAEADSFEASKRRTQQGSGGFVPLQHNMSNLELLKLDWMKSLTTFDPPVPLFALHTLSLLASHSLGTPDFILAVQGNCPNLQDLSLAEPTTSIHPVCFEAIGQMNLVRLNLSEVDNVALDTIRLLIRHEDRTAGINTQRPITRTLTSLMLSGCDRLDDDSVALISHSFLSLQELDLSGCTLLTDVSLGHLHNLSSDQSPLKPPPLRKLKLSGCENVTDAGLSLLLHGPSFPDSKGESVNPSELCGCSSRPATVEHSYPLRLTHLDLSELPRITQSSLLMLARHRTDGLQLVDVVCCDGLDGEMEEDEEEEEEDDEDLPEGMEIEDTRVLTEEQKQQSEKDSRELKAFLKSVERKKYQRNPIVDQIVILLMMKGVTVNKEITYD